MQSEKQPGLREGVADGVPIMVGYFPVAMAFGLLAKTVGVTLADACLFSLVVFAGASQFMALDLIKAGIAAVDIVLATFLLNLRHMMMSASLAVRLRGVRRGLLPVIAFGVTDETFSVASLRAGGLTASYLLGLNGAAYVAWAAGTVAGYLIGQVLPAAVQSSLGIGLYALFAAILVPGLKQNKSALIIVLLSGLLYLLLSSFTPLSSGWSLIAAIIAAAAGGLVALENGGEEEI
ncbi:AzlC family ABC transporter permease [Anaeroselena agilis]|uniref:AzlC family ABC transporter permease n=1 Tax=Anaeroselena agilis TaxID=3063788 RepID=A0ABU3P1K6_9FIRM|nr:AzlC family ABC transporter permease [Selenomonadales bacterium 4137-cl]